MWEGRREKKEKKTLPGVFEDEAPASKFEHQQQLLLIVSPANSENLKIGSRFFTSSLASSGLF